ncbi:hypothetical protein BLNAU_22230 [Blattamonas nauphoetae]|uniref:VDE lipocalin domain-containing protein n=1 Tax=Blattamonas nauphoetae TaxID=2049346 RepID=A0ABQ9WTL7_9EUKA|nr:hypothetical protein BLNAU_23351 [Blattamonas nauphoetae]KAK2942846.1 hypothetical protein BLNAU_22230 [Blattamonas nauphoetae]
MLRREDGMCPTLSLSLKREHHPMQTSPPNKLRTRTPPNPTRRLALSPNSHRHSSLVFLALQTIVLFILTVNTRSTLTRAMCCSIRFMSVSLRRRESCIARSILSSLSFCQQNCRSSLLNCVELCSSQQTPLPNSPNTRPSFSMHNTERCVDQCYQKSEGCVLDCGKSDMTECERTCITKLTQCTAGDSGEDNEKNGEKKEEKRGDGMSIMFSQFKIGHEAKATKGCVLPAGVFDVQSTTNGHFSLAASATAQSQPIKLKPHQTLILPLLLPQPLHPPHLPTQTTPLLSPHQHQTSWHHCHAKTAASASSKSKLQNVEKTENVKCDIENVASTA